MSPRRRVPEPNAQVVIVGAGLAGLSAALHLRGGGRQVTVIEAEHTPGGRVGSYRGPGYDIDNGATVLTMPELVGDALAAVGASAVGTVPPLDIRQLTPAYHARFADGTALDVHSDADRMVAEVTRVCGADEATRYLRLRKWLGDIFDAEYDRFMASDFDSPLDLVATASARRDLWKVIRLGGFGRLGRRVDATLRDPRLRRIFTFQALYAGVPPRSALAVYGAIAHMDTTLGVYFPRGGMRTVALSMADALTTAGGSVEYGRRVVSVQRSGSRVTGVVLDDGSTRACDALVLTPDAAVVDELLPPRRRITASRRSPSAVVLHGTVPTAVTAHWPSRRHHTIDFGEAWELTFAQITARRGGTLMSDPSLLLTRPAVTDPDLLVQRSEDPQTEAEPLSILAPCPNLDSAPLDWANLGSAYVTEILLTLESRGYRGISRNFRLDHLDTPLTWLERGMAAGSPFADAHLFRQTGPFRRSNMIRRYDNVVLAGSSTVPGVGVPSVLLSGRLAAERILTTTEKTF